MCTNVDVARSLQAIKYASQMNFYNVYFAQLTRRQSRPYEIPQITYVVHLLNCFVTHECEILKLIARMNEHLDKLPRTVKDDES